MEKVVLVEGEWGTKPSENCRCEIEVDGIRRHFIVGDDTCRLERDLSLCLISMNQGEIAKFSTDGREMTVHLVTVVQDGFIHQWSVEKKIKIALKHKDDGVALFKSNQALDASYRWVKALKVISSIPIDVANQDENKDIIKYIDNLKTNLYSNIASYYCKVGNNRKTIEACKKVLEFDDTHVKCHYKMGMAYMNERNFEKAEQSFTRVLDVEPTNKAAIENLKSARRQLEDANLKYNSLVKRMFQ